MRRSTIQKIVKGLFLTAVTLASGSRMFQAGCVDTGFDYGYYDYIDPWVVQDVLDYRQSVYDSANDAWDEYIRM